MVELLAATLWVRKYLEKKLAMGVINRTMKKLAENTIVFLALTLYTLFFWRFIWN